MKALLLEMWTKFKQLDEEVRVIHGGKEDMAVI